MKRLVIEVTSVEDGLVTLKPMLEVDGAIVRIFEAYTIWEGCTISFKNDEHLEKIKK